MEQKEQQKLIMAVLNGEDYESGILENVAVGKVLV